MCAIFFRSVFLSVGWRNHLARILKCLSSETSITSQTAGIHLLDGRYSQGYIVKRSHNLSVTWTQRCVQWITKTCVLSVCIIYLCIIENLYSFSAFLLPGLIALISNLWLRTTRANSLKPFFSAFPSRNGFADKTFNDCSTQKDVRVKERRNFGPYALVCAV